MSKKKPRQPPPYGNLAVYLNGEWLCSKGGWLKAYTRKNGTHYVNWYGRRIDINEEGDFEIHVTTKEGMVHGFKNEPVTRAWLERWINPEFYDWCQDNEETHIAAPPTTTMDEVPASVLKRLAR